MPRNVEIKARVHDAEALRQRAEALADGPPQLIEQEDVFFRSAEGRLKLRRFTADRGELIFYRRPDAAGPSESQFLKAATLEPKALAAALEAALGTVGVVRKRRSLLLTGQTRIHLDRVEGLGDFLELEVVLHEGQSAEEGAEIARGLMAELGIAEEDLISQAYIDLLLDKD